MSSCSTCSCLSCPDHSRVLKDLSTRANPSSLSDAQWELIAPLLPAPVRSARRGGRPEKWPRRLGGFQGWAPTTTLWPRHSTRCTRPSSSVTRDPGRTSTPSSSPPPGTTTNSHNHIQINRPPHNPGLDSSQDATGFQVLHRRWVVERTFTWLTANHRLVRDYKTLPDHHEDMIYIAMIHLVCQRLATH